MKHIKFKNMETMVFDNIHELITSIETLPKNPDAEDSSESGSQSFTGTNSLKDAVNLMVKGDSKLMDKIESRKADVKDLNLFVDGVKRKFVNDVVGFIPNVPNAVMGIPTNMIRMERVVHKQKILNFAVNMSVNSGVSQEDILNNSRILFGAVEHFEKQGYRCNIWTGSVSHGDDGIYHGWMVRVKTDNQPFNKLKMVFPMTHPSMLRRIGFAVDEIHDSWLGGGYGRPTRGDESKKVIQHMLGIDNVFVVDVMKLKDLQIEGLEKGALNLEWKRNIT